MGWGGLYDEVGGGFFRYADTRDWQQPHLEKMLETNAAMLRLYLDAGVRLGIARFTERAADILRYVQHLRRPRSMEVGGVHRSPRSSTRRVSRRAQGTDGPSISRSVC